ncbi:energy-coupling factor transporter transmembrane protein EcfT [Sporolactobacillus sp. CPB3-1]|uniref:Energy-coupling factor transporter transmembrane protein EcfT n=1 Tax=Sporolactobacillus mangiferae TaxID=2940498 RepID=A0ABT0ME77_9BACL|nr:energy-coupling factor transporter transmembrane component T [Sporolactobacillus mangiferae]MCL1632908.1 energy-coupling factor transporter transmembrane protein EcfT [Sporolactobacillus mangiferae]
MARDLTVGQFLPGHAIMHRLDPRTKILLTFFFIIQVFLAKSTVSLCFLIILLFLFIFFARLSAGKVFRAVRPMIPVIVFTALINIFYVPGDSVLHFAFLHITKQGLFTGFTLFVRLTVLIVGCSLITYTTSLNALAAGLEQLLSPLAHLRVPVSELSMTLTITLRFLPSLSDEFEQIVDAQKSRGAFFDQGSPIRRIKSYFPVLIPLFMSAFRRAFELANAIECRCYHGGKGRTKMNTLHFAGRDIAAFLVFTALFFLTIIFNFI